MDNLTHTLIGTLIGEAVARTTKPDEQGLPAGTRRNLLVVLAAIGSNLPDADLLYSFAGGKINYLLHHRGHTHTILGALSLAAVAFVLAQWWLRRRGLKATRTDQRWLAGILLFTPLLHIAMDATNNYGVHPFWPLYNGWLYGDSVFIAEPLLWAACAPLVFLLRTPLARAIVALLLALGAGLALFSGLLPAGVAVAFASIMAALLALGRWAPPRVALAAAIALWAGTTATFIAASHAAGRHVEQLAAHLFPHARLLDHVLTPMPANPLCWEVILVQSETDEQQRRWVALRRGVLSLAPGWITAAGCGSARLAGPITAPLREIGDGGNSRLASGSNGSAGGRSDGFSAANDAIGAGVRGNAAAASGKAGVEVDDSFRLFGEVLTPQDQLANLVAANCEASAAMRFIRAPWLAPIGGRQVLGDLRYDREKALGFAEIALHEQQQCPVLAPRWLPPRSDLLQQ